MRRIASLSAGLLAGLIITGSAAAEGVKPEDAIDYRQSAFTMLKWNFGPMGAMVKGKMEYDPNAFIEHAERVAWLSHMPLEGFVEGSAQGDTEAKPAIWEEWDHFEEYMTEFQDEASKLAEVAKSRNLDEIRPQFVATGKSCKACHDDFKEE